MPPDPRKVFIIHGRNIRAAEEMARFVQAVGLEPNLFRDIRARLGGTPTMADIVTRGMDESLGAIALFTGDEYALLRAELRLAHDAAVDLSRWQARPNVVFEAGMAFGRDRSRVVIVLLGDVQLFTDVAGIHVLRPSNDPGRDRETLRATLAEMGCSVSATSAWMTAGDFDGCILPSDDRIRPLPASLGSRGELPKMGSWAPALKASDILIVGQNLNLVMRQKPYFHQRLTSGARLRLLIVNPKNDTLIDIMSRGVLEHMFTRTDFGPSLQVMDELRRALTERERVRLDLRTIDYVPTLSCQVLDGDKPWGTVLVELAPNKVEVPNRPHILLFAENPVHTAWYQHFRKNFEDMFDAGIPWSWP